jgi:hypothetical protein
MRIYWLLFLPVLLSGCHNGSPPPSRSPAAPRPAGFARAANPADRVSRIPEFRKAEDEFTAGHFAQAASLMERVERNNSLSTAELRWLREQRNVCLKRAGRPAVELPAEVRPAAFSGARTVRQADCGPRALAIAAARMGVRAPLERLTKLAGTTRFGTTMEGLAGAAKAIGLRAEGVQVDRQGLADLGTPAIAWMDRNHYAAVLSVKGDPEDGTAMVHDPNRREPQEVPQAQLMAESGGYLLELRR